MNYEIDQLRTDLTHVRLIHFMLLLVCLASIYAIYSADVSFEKLRDDMIKIDWEIRQIDEEKSGIPFNWRFDLSRALKNEHDELIASLKRSTDSRFDFLGAETDFMISAVRKPKISDDMTMSQIKDKLEGATWEITYIKSMEPANPEETKKWIASLGDPYIIVVADDNFRKGEGVVTPQSKVSIRFYAWYRAEDHKDRERKEREIEFIVKTGIKDVKIEKRDWLFGQYKAFKNNWSHIKDSQLWNVQEQYWNLRNKEMKNKEFAVLGLALKVENIGVVILILYSLFAYMIAHLSHILSALSKMSIDERSLFNVADISPWIGTLIGSSAWHGKIIGWPLAFLAIVALPTYTVNSVYKESTSLVSLSGVSISLVLTFATIFLGFIVIFMAWRIGRSRCAVMPNKANSLGRQKAPPVICDVTD